MDIYYGQQVALIGFGDGRQAERTELPLAFDSSTAREVGRSTVARLPQNIILMPTLIRRDSA